MNAPTDAAPVSRLRRLALALAVAFPWLLLHVRVAAEISMDVISVGFVLQCALDRQWGWLRQAWGGLAAAWWAWLVGCTAVNLALPGQDAMALAQAVGLGRFLLFAAALESWVLRDRPERRWLYRSLCLATGYVALQTLLQFATGHNLYGAPRWGDGSLTGPFHGPRAGPTFVRMLFPALLPMVGGPATLRSPRAVLGGLALLLGSIGVVVLIGQRMPVLLAVLGLVVAGLFLRRIRLQVAVAILAGGVLVAASAVVSPPTFYRLVTKFSGQMEDFADSPYGLIAERAVAIAEQHPWTGRGYDGFHTGCPEPRYFQGWLQLEAQLGLQRGQGSVGPADGGGADICATHPHNYYLQAVTDSGLPGLVLFCAMLGSWFHRLGRNLLRRPDPLRIGLFVAFLIQAWPIASTSPMQSLPIGGWFFLLLGFGLAEAAHAGEHGRLGSPAPDGVAADRAWAGLTVR